MNLYGTGLLNYVVYLATTIKEAEHEWCRRQAQRCSPPVHAYQCIFQSKRTVKGLYVITNVQHCIFYNYPNIAFLIFLCGKIIRRLYIHLIDNLFFWNTGNFCSGNLSMFGFFIIIIRRIVFFLPDKLSNVEDERADSVQNYQHAWRFTES